MKHLIYLALTFFSISTFAQMPVNGSVLYGNEWIDYDKTYFKAVVDEDGLYRITRQELEDAGFNLSNISLGDLEMHHLGKSVPFYVNPSDDFIEFVGEKNKGEIDRFLYNNEEDHFNSRVSLVTDKAAYFISMSESGNDNLINNTITDLSGNSLSAEQYYMHTEEIVISDNYYKTVVRGGGQIRYSNVVASEGYGSSLLNSSTINIPVSDVYESGPTASGFIRYGGNDINHKTQVSLEGDSVLSIISSNPSNVVYDFEYANTELDDEFSINLMGQFGTSDKNRIALASLKYPRNYSMNGMEALSIEQSADASNQYIEMEDYGFNDRPIIYDIESKQRIEAELLDNNKFGFIAVQSTSDKSLQVYAPEAVKSVKSITQKEFTDYSDGEYNYLIVTSEVLRNEGNIDNVQEYANYRSSAVGGGYDVLIVDIEELYDQFAYGIDRHFIAIRNYGYWADKTYPDVEFMFIVGKGRGYVDQRNDLQISENEDSFVPTFGHPGSDNLLVSDNVTPLPLYPIGRLAAKNTQEVADYLKKVIAHDANKLSPQTIADRAWHKKVLHLSGGDEGLQPTIANYLENMADTLRADYYGAEVTTFYKQSIENIEVTTSDKIFKLINDGLGIITFFGHSTVGTFDFSLDNIENYENFEKYPFVMSLGCHSGNIHTDAKSISEKFVVQKDKGAIFFLAASGTAYLGQQYLSGRSLYAGFADLDYGKPLGVAIRNVIEEYAVFTDVSYVTFLQQLTLHGDPAVQLLQSETPDIIPDATSVSTNPTFVDTYEDSFELCFDVVNIGKFSRDSINIFIEHKAPDGTVVTDSIIRDMMPSYANSYCLNLPIKETNLVGKNTINIIVDYSEEVAESPAPEAELNNRLINESGSEGFDFYILNNSAIPIYPKEFAIVNDDQVSLVASTYNALGEEQKFVFQLDTTELFDSPQLRETEISQVNGIAAWNLDFPLTEKQEYYWRISPDSSTTGVGYVWDGSSFVYDTPAFDGWNQSHYYQHLSDDFDKMNLKQNRNLFFATNLKEILIINKVWESGSPATFNIDNSFKSSMMDRNASPSMGVAVVDTFGKFLMNPVGGAFGAINPRTKEIRTFYFKMDEQQSRIDFMNFLENEVPDRYYVCLYNIFRDNNTDFKVPDWAADADVNNGVNIFSYLEAQGSQDIRYMEEQQIGLPYAFIYRKGVSPLAEDIGEERSDVIEIKEGLPGFWFEGMLRSDFIGPASNWTNIEWEVDENTNLETDTVFLRVFGYDSNQANEELLFDNVEARNFDLSTVSAEQYPFIKVEYYATDVVDVSPVQLKWWRVYFEGIGDIAINTTSRFDFHADSLQQGEKLTLSYDVSNFSNANVGATGVTYTLTNTENNSIVAQGSIPELPSLGTENINFEYDTKELLGEYQLQIDVNPNKAPEELYYFNNFGATTFKVVPDRTNPIMDVTFDGVRIMDHDIVSANPLISVQLTDENQYLLLDDKDDFTIFLDFPDNTTQEISNEDPDLQFFPATGGGDDNVARLEYNPKLEVDGTYTLRVDAQDVSNNASGSRNYEVNFRVFNEEMVSNVFNYPNPFSTSTQFIFTLTGDEEPGNVLIRIMTLSGKVVREITMAELGQVNIGLNKTEYKWDGTDEFGDKLGNGVYLYQVVTKRLNGSDYKKFNDPTQNNTDYLFKEGFGKLVIMR